ncbi:ATP-binding protein [Haloprofundus sp. MHR1]|uniref:ATP-binding protein n=1 Tax=Haloprofundus sp. MHR1 TaxID=2572921 RepID=UPI0010BF291C|nr:ATP-binding protein [Haloprofundus sp. MHR1]QCJ47279.1 ATP-binding protein [Haloprofundus sp. MHR1]
MHVLGRTAGEFESRNPQTGATRPTGRLGTYRARDGSDAAPVGIDFDEPHAAFVVGKRGSGKSYTLGVLAEAAARADGVAPVVVDPMGVFSGLAAASSATDVAATVVETPAVAADSLPPASWPGLVGLDSESPAGTVVWQAATEENSLSAMRTYVADADAGETARRAARNHLRLADSWGVFDPAGLAVDELLGGEATVLDLSETPDAPANAVCAAVAGGLYERCASAVSSPLGEPTRLPWLFVDEAHAFFDGVAADALRTVLTRGRAPGMSLVAATQRPSALPDVAVSQADLLVAHRLTMQADVDALTAAQPTYLAGTIRERLPTRTGDALVVDDTTESAHAVRIRERDTPHGGGNPRASRVADGADGRGDRRESGEST